MDIYTALGYFGTFCVAFQYLLMITEKIDAFGLKACLVNCFGSSLIMLSLYYHYNGPAFYIEGYWASVSFYGVLRNLKKIKQKKDHSNT